MCLPQRSLIEFLVKRCLHIPPMVINKIFLARHEKYCGRMYPWKIMVSIGEIHDCRGNVKKYLISAKWMGWSTQRVEIANS